MNPPVHQSGPSEGARVKEEVAAARVRFLGGMTSLVRQTSCGGGPWAAALRALVRGSRRARTYYLRLVS